jgi:hypothetical protein
MIFIEKKFLPYFTKADSCWMWISMIWWRLTARWQTASKRSLRTTWHCWKVCCRWCSCCCCCCCLFVCLFVCLFLLLFFCCCCCCGWWCRYLLLFMFLCWEPRRVAVCAWRVCVCVCVIVCFFFLFFYFLFVVFCCFFCFFVCSFVCLFVWPVGWLGLVVCVCVCACVCVCVFWRSCLARAHSLAPSPHTQPRTAVATQTAVEEFAGTPADPQQGATTTQQVLTRERERERERERGGREHGKKKKRRRGEESEWRRNVKTPSVHRGETGKGATDTSHAADTQHRHRDTRSRTPEHKTHSTPTATLSHDNHSSPQPQRLHCACR